MGGKKGNTISTALLKQEPENARQFVAQVFFTQDGNQRCITYLTMASLAIHLELTINSSCIILHTVLLHSFPHVSFF